MQRYTFKEHFIELKNRLLRIICFFIISFGVCYYFIDEIYNFFLSPLSSLISDGNRKIIYTGLTEAFFSYIKLAIFSAFCITLPVICYQCYAFVTPGLILREKRIVSATLGLSPILFYLGGLFVFYFVMPRAWEFFLSYENSDIILPLVLEARISEYLSLVIQLTLAFGIAFQLPIIMVILAVIGLVSSHALKEKRRIAIVIIFIIAAIFTPPDVISQIALAIPLLLLYEVSILLCKLVEKKGS
jgi:sec-independent protein translocase protein TatC